MKPKQMMLFTVAIGCGLVAMIGAQQVLSGNKAPEQEMIDILVAKTDLAPGTVLDKTNVGLRKYAKEHAPEGSITTEAEWTECATKIPVITGMPILKNYLGPKGASGLNTLIPSGMQVVTVPVDSAQAHSGLLRAGSYVSIGCTIDRDTGNGGRTRSTEVKTVLERVKVIAVGEQVAGTEEAKKAGNSGKVENVSLVTYPIQAKLLYLALAVSNKRLHFLMLPEGDKSIHNDRDITEADLVRKSSELQGIKQPEIEVAQKNDVSSSDERPKGSSFSDYLKDKPVDSSVADVGKEPSRPTWKITIYKGDKAEHHEVELPKDSPESTRAEPAFDNDWTTPILKFFSRKPAKTAVQETQSTRSDDDVVEPQTGKSAARILEHSRR